MAKIRRSFRLVIEGDDGEPVTLDVETNAWDLIRAERPDQGSVQQGLRTAHLACIRQRRPVPPRFEDFATALIDFTDTTGDDDETEEDGGGDLDPTQRTGSDLSP